MTKFTLPHISIVVQDVEKTKKFYEKIGFSIIDNGFSEEKQRDYVLFEGYNLQIEMWHYRENNNAESASDDPQQVGIIHFALAHANLTALAEKFHSKGIPFHKELQTSSGGITYFFVKDPSGILVEFVEYPK